MEAETSFLVVFHFVGVLPFLDHVPTRRVSVELSISVVYYVVGRCETGFRIRIPLPHLHTHSTLSLDF